MISTLTTSTSSYYVHNTQTHATHTHTPTHILYVYSPNIHIHFLYTTVLLVSKSCQSIANSETMRLHKYLSTIAIVALCIATPADAQFFNAFRNIFRPVQNLFGGVMRGVGQIFNGGGSFTDDGTQSPQATGIDDLFPDDCGRDTDAGTGKLCFPDGLLCRDRKF